MVELAGIHHVSAFTTRPEENVHFYTEILGMRMVKKTVNQDNPSSYHLFYGDRVGHPGTSFTFFDLPRLAQTRYGTKSISNVALRVASQESLTFWQKRFSEWDLAHGEVRTENNRYVLDFQSLEGQSLKLVADDGEDGVEGGEPKVHDSIPVSNGIVGLGPVTLTVQQADPTIRTLQELLGFRSIGSYYAYHDAHVPVDVLATGVGGAGAEVHVEEQPGLRKEQIGRGGVHHVAFRVPTFEELESWVVLLDEAGFEHTGIVDRFYFQSIYFREPGGILYELATDGPGYTADEDEAHLGERLALPPFLEAKREEIEATLKPLS